MPSPRSLRLAFSRPCAADTPPDQPRRGDVVLRQLPDDTWAVQDHAAEPLSAITYEDVRDARQHAERLAENRDGAVWLWSDRPRRFERR